MILTAWWRSRLTRKTSLLLLSSGNSTSIKAQHVICRSRRVLVGGVAPPQPGGQRFYPERGPPRLLTPLGRGEGIRSRFLHFRHFYFLLLRNLIESARTLFGGSFALACRLGQGGDRAVVAADVEIRDKFHVWVAAIYLQQHMLAQFS